jgi:hypothetical protein
MAGEVGALADAEVTAAGLDVGGDRTLLSGGQRCGRLIDAEVSAGLQVEGRAGERLLVDRTGPVGAHVLRLRAGQGLGDPRGCRLGASVTSCGPPVDQDTRVRRG